MVSWRYQPLAHSTGLFGHVSLNALLHANSLKHPTRQHVTSSEDAKKNNRWTKNKNQRILYMLHLEIIHEMVKRFGQYTIRKALLDVWVHRFKHFWHISKLFLQSSDGKFRFWVSVFSRLKVSVRRVFGREQYIRLVFWNNWEKLLGCKIKISLIGS